MNEGGSVHSDRVKTVCRYLAAGYNQCDSGCVARSVGGNCRSRAAKVYNRAARDLKARVAVHLYRVVAREDTAALRVGNLDACAAGDLKRGRIRGPFITAKVNDEIAAIDSHGALGLYISHKLYDSSAHRLCIIYCERKRGVFRTCATNDKAYRCVCRANISREACGLGKFLAILFGRRGHRIGLANVILLEGVGVCNLCAVDIEGDCAVTRSAHGACALVEADNGLVRVYNHGGSNLFYYPVKVGLACALSLAHRLIFL